MEESRICNDLLLQIFLRVPKKSVFRFKCVSKYWRDQLSKDSFRRMYESMRIQSSSSLLPLSGLFHGSHGKNGPSKLCFAPTCKQSMFVRSRRFIDTLGFFLGSSNGLILCGSFPLNFYVCNPITDQFVQIPQPHNNIIYDPNHRVIGFLYEEDGHDTNRPTYTIIRADCSSENRKYLLTETYTSDSGVWTETLLQGEVDFRLSPVWPSWPCRVVGQIFYWMAVCPSMLIARDSKAKHEWVWQILFPSERNDGWSFARNILGESTTDGHLLFGYHGFFGFNVMRLRKKLRDYSPYKRVPPSEWICITLVFYNDEILLEKRPSLIAFHPQSSRFILMKFRQTLFWYDLEKAESTSIWCLPLPFLEDKNSLIPYFQPEWPPSPHL